MYFEGTDSESLRIYESACAVQITNPCEFTNLDVMCRSQIYADIQITDIQIG